MTTSVLIYLTWAVRTAEKLTHIEVKRRAITRRLKTSRLLLQIENTKSEARNAKLIRSTKIQMTQTESYDPHYES